MNATRGARRSAARNAAAGVGWFVVVVLVFAAVRSAAAADADGAPPDRLRVSGVVPPPSEGLRDRLTVIFDRPIAPLATATGVTSSPMTFSPALTGTFEYGPNYITFRRTNQNGVWPVVGAEISPLVRSADGKPLDESQRKILLTDHPFKAQRLWHIDTSKVRVLLGLEFTLPVTPAEVAKRLELRDASDRLIQVAGVVAGPNRNAIGLQLPPDTALPVRVRVAAGTPDATDLVRTDAAEDLTVAAPPVLPTPTATPAPALAVQNMQLTDLKADAQRIRVHLGASVAAASMKQAVRVTDSSTTVSKTLACEVTPVTDTGNKPQEAAAFDIQFHAPNPGNLKIRVTLAAGLKSTDNRTLATDYSQEFTHYTQFQLASDNWETWGRDGLRLNLYIQCEGSLSEKELADHLTVSPPLKHMEVTRQYGTSFQILGDWLVNQDYTLTVRPGMTYAGWAKTTSPYTRTVHTPEKVDPYIGFASTDKYYLPRHRDAEVTLETRGVKSVNVALYRIFPSNLPVASQNWTNANGNWNFSEDWAERLATRTVEIAASNASLRTTTTLPLAGILPADKRGVFYVNAGGGSDRGELLLLTDMGMLAHWQDKRLVVFVHDLFTLDPLRGVSLTAYSRKLQVLGTAKTGADGLANFENLDTERLGSPSLVVADTGRDTTFLRLAPTGGQAIGDDGGGEYYRPRAGAPREDRDPFGADLQRYDAQRADGYLYADRDLYRPGDTVHLRWIVRQHYGDALPQVPLKLRVVKPNGKDLFAEPVTLSEWGTGSRDIETRESYATGQYSAELTIPGGKQPVGSYTFQVEEFVPNRIEAKLEVPQPLWVGDGTANEILVTARNLFGTPADARTAEASVVLERGYTFPDWKAYRFDNDEPMKLSPINLGQQQTDKDGKAHFAFSHTAPADIRSPLTARVCGRVLELGGRAVNAAAAATYFPSNVCLGIAVENGDEPGSVRVHAVAVRPDGKAVTDLDQVNVTLEREDWRYSVRRYSSYMEPYWSSGFLEVETKSVALTDGQGTATFKPRDWGYYRVRVHSPRTQQMSSLRFSSYYYRCSVMRADEPSLIKVKLDRESYSVGDEVAARIESPFDGRALVVLQGETIRETRTVAVKDGVGELRFRVGREDCPNLWVEATVVHAIGKAHRQVYPFSSFAAAAVVVKDPARRIQVALPRLPEEVRPEKPCEVEIETTDAKGRALAAEVTLAAVDEGIHGIKGYTNPDPLAFFGRTRRPDYNRAHYYDRVAYDFDEPTPGGGEGEEGEMGKRLGRGATNWIKTVALWSGTVRTDAQGHATVKLDVPQFTGQLRLVAVAANASASGSAAKQMYVRQPYMLRTSMPRFLLPGDSATCSAVVFNTTDEPRKARLTWSCDGALSATLGAADLVVAPKGEAHAFAKIAARQTIGQGRIVWKAQVTDVEGNAVDSLNEEAPLPVNEPAAFESFTELKILKAGESLDVRNTRFREDEMAEMKLTVSAAQTVHLQDALARLVGYPYGCIEQTTSKLMPVYLARKNRDFLKSALGKNVDLDAMVRTGVDRLFTMQTPSGGLSYWPGGTEPYPYGSVYAFHCLTLVRNGREVPVPADNYATLKEYIRRLATNTQDGSPSGLYQRAYAVYTLALADDKQAVELIQRLDSLQVPRSGRYLLAAALARCTHDSDRVRLYLTSSPMTVWNDREPYGTLCSVARNQAVELLANLEIDTPTADIVKQADVLAAYIDKTGFYTTHDTSFVLAALLEYINRFMKEGVKAEAVVTADDGAEGRVTGNDFYTASHRGAGSHFTVRNTGQTEVFVNVATRGIPLKPKTEAVANGMSVKRRFLTADGQPREGATFRQGETAIVEIEIKCERTAKNVILADLLPGGFEIDNPRLNAGAGAGVPLPHKASQPAHMEVRDDRLVLAFDELTGYPGVGAEGAHYFYYVVNCVTPGEYQQPAVTAECMYDPETRSASAASKVAIQAPAQ